MQSAFTFLVELTGIGPVSNRTHVKTVYSGFRFSNGAVTVVSHRALCVSPTSPLLGAGSFRTLLEPIAYLAGQIQRGLRRLSRDSFVSVS